MRSLNPGDDRHEIYYMEIFGDNFCIHHLIPPGDVSLLIALVPPEEMFWTRRLGTQGRCAWEDVTLRDVSLRHPNLLPHLGKAYRVYRMVLGCVRMC